MVVVVFNHFLHPVIPFAVGKLSDNGIFYISLCLTGDSFVINNNFGVKNLLFYPFIEVVRY
jgi:hypothetical protein